MYEAYSLITVFPTISLFANLIHPLPYKPPPSYSQFCYLGFFCGVLIEFNQNYLCDHGLGITYWTWLGSPVNAQ